MNVLDVITVSDEVSTAPSEVLVGYVTIMTNIEVREYLNAGLIALNGVILVMIARQLFDFIRNHGWDWTKHPGAISACAFWWIFVADFMRACLAWYLLHEQNMGRAVNYLSPFVTSMYIAAAIIGTAATLRLVYALSPDSWGHRGWVTALVFTVVLILGLQIYH